MNYKKLSFAALFSISILMINGIGNAAPLSKNANLLSDMGPTGYAAPIIKKAAKKQAVKKIPCKPMPEKTGAACPIQAPAPCNPCAQPCAPCNPCPTPCEPCNPCPAPCNPCPTGAASPMPCPAPCNPCAQPCEPCNPCPAPCNPCN